MNGIDDLLGDIYGYVCIYVYVYVHVDVCIIYGLTGEGVDGYLHKY
jgi:hypothetical protein